MKRKKNMPKIVIKTIAVASFITLNILGGTAWGMWEELDTNTQRRIIATHIKDVTIEQPPKFSGSSSNIRDTRGYDNIMGNWGRSLPQSVHTGGWLENWPNVGIETTCAACKQEIQTAYTTLVLPLRLSSQNTSNALLQQQNDLLRQQISLMSQTPAPQ